MDPDAIRAFARRNRSDVAALKQQHWARQYRESAGEATLRAGHALWEYVRRVRPDWPTERDRVEDLAHHVELKRQLDRAADAFNHPLLRAAHPGDLDFERITEPLTSVGSTP